LEGENRGRRQGGVEPSGGQVGPPRGLISSCAYSPEPCLGAKNPRRLVGAPSKNPSPPHGGVIFRASPQRPVGIFPPRVCGHRRGLSPPPTKKGCKTLFVLWPPPRGLFGKKPRPKVFSTGEFLPIPKAQVSKHFWEAI